MPCEEQISVVLGSLNRLPLLKCAIASIERNGFPGNVETIVVDGGSTDGTLEWLSRRPDIVTIVQPNSTIELPDGSRRKKHSWGEFINLGFRQASSEWIVMISDDVILCPGALLNGLRQLTLQQSEGKRLGGGAFYYRDYPRSKSYHVKLLPNSVVHINHGFFSAQALAAVGYADETHFNFYYADSDLSMRLNLTGWETVPLESSYAEHLTHRVNVRALHRTKQPSSAARDMAVFENKYGHMSYQQRSLAKAWHDPEHSGIAFWSHAPVACLQGAMLRLLYDPFNR